MPEKLSTKPASSTNAPYMLSWMLLDWIVRRAPLRYRPMKLPGPNSTPVMDSDTG